MRAVRTALLAVGVAVAMVGCAPAQEPDRGAGVEAAPVAAGESHLIGPSEVVHGVPVGWRRDEDGARAAAVSAVSLSGEIARAGFITRADMIEALATVRFEPDLTAESDAQQAALTDELGDVGVPVRSLLLRELPLTARVVAADRDRATVEVWSVVVLGVPRAAAGRQAWRTVVVELAWEGDDWQVDGWSARPGPTPALPTQQPVASLDELREVADWPPAERVG